MATEKSLAGQLFSLLGLSGSGMPVDTIAPRANNPAAQEKLYADFIANTQVGNPNVWAAYNSSMQRPGSYDEMLKLWDEMTSWDLLSTAITELVDEVTQTDYSTDRVLWYECNDRAVEDQLNKKVEEDWEVNTVLTSQVWYETAMGNNFEKLHYEAGKGVLGMTWAHPMDVKRYWLVKNRRCVGFKWNGQKPNKDDLYMQGGRQVPRVALGDPNHAEDLWYPWDFCHIRRMYKMRISEHGEPIFNEVQGIYKKLRMALDQMLVYRAQVQPDRYAIKIDTGDQPPIEQMKTIARWKQQFRNKLAFGAGGQQGGYGPPTDFKSYYDAQALDTILWISQPKGFNHGIDKLNGTSSVPDVYDIELLTNLFFSAMRMPKSWLGIGDTTNGPQSGKALLAQDMRFLRAAKSIRKPIISAYTNLAYFDQLLMGRDITNLNIKAKMSDIGSLEDQLRLELLSTQMELMDKVGNVLQRFGIPTQDVVELLFKRYMHLPDDVINSIITAIPNTMPQQEGTKAAPSRREMLNIIDEKVRQTPEAGRLIFEIDQLNKQGPKRLAEITGHQLRQGHVLPTGKQLQESIDGIPPNSTVVSSYGDIAGLVGSLTEAKSSEPAARRWSPLGS